MRKFASPGVADVVRVWGPIALVVAIAFAIAFQYVGSPPPRVIRIATGRTDGAYYAFAQAYATRLAADGLTLEVVPTAGSVDNYERLTRGDVTLALVQGGSATPEDQEAVESLGALFLEPVWILARAGRGIARLPDLEGKRIALGATGSGMDRLATELLVASGITSANTTLVRPDVESPGSLLESGEVDAAILVASAEAPVVGQIVARPDVSLVPIRRTQAYSRRFRFLAPVTIGEGVLDLQRNLPPAAVDTLAASANLVARRGLHPALVPALLDAVTRVHAGGGVLEGPRQFPAVDYSGLPVNEDAARYLRNGPSFLYRWLPYGTAVVVDRLKLLLLPLLALVIPLLRIAPPLYQWRVRSRIYRWYREVRDVDGLLLAGGTSVEALRSRLDALERDVASVAVPLAYTGEQYHLRLHIRLLQDRVNAASVPPAAPAGRE